MTTADNKVALVTGANKGIGKAAAEGLAKLGYTVFLGSRDEDRGKEAAAELSKYGKVIPVQLTVNDPLSISKAVQQVANQFGKLDVLVNNAGVRGDPHKVSEVGLNKLKETMETNFYGVVLVTNAFLPLINQSPAGRIVNVSSVVGSFASTDPVAKTFQTPFSVYRASKAAVNAFTASWAEELANTNIKVNSICPGYTQTEMTNGDGSGVERTPQQGAVIIIKMATLDKDGPTGGFFDDHGSIPF